MMFPHSMRLDYPQVNCLVPSAKKELVEKSQSSNKKVDEGLEKVTSDAISSVQKGLLAYNNPIKLNRNSEECKFFGVDKPENIYSSECSERHELLNGFYRRFGVVLGLGADIKNPTSGIFEPYFDPDKRKITTFWKELNESSIKAGKLTLSGDYNGRSVIHSIGFVKDNDKLFIIDSLGNENPVMKDFHKVWKVSIENYLDSNGEEVPEIIFNQKPQQSMDELTCNNWVYANLEKITGKIRVGKNVSSETLDSVLPKDINEILSKHMGIVKFEEKYMR